MNKAFDLMITAERTLTSDFAVTSIQLRKQLKEQFGLIPEPPHIKVAISIVTADDNYIKDIL